MTKLALLAVHKIVSEYAEKIYAYLEKTQRDTKLRISRFVMVQHENLLDLYFLYKMGWIKPKNHFTILSLLKEQTANIFASKNMNKYMESLVPVLCAAYKQPNSSQTPAVVPHHKSHKSLHS